MSELVSTCSVLPDISKPRYDQSTYEGRARHFFSIVNPMNLFVTPSTLDECQKIIVDYRNGKVRSDLSVDELWQAKQLYDSAFHPDSGEKMFILGRMSAQVPCNMIITGGMLTFYKSFRGVVFWHWLNQSFNAMVNYTNRSGPNPVSPERLLTSYACATTGALTAALGLNKLVSLYNLSGMAGRLVPFAAIGAANAINIPMMRSSELEKGIELRSVEGELVANSKRVAGLAIAMVVLSRVSMALPYMTITPLIMHRVANTSFYKAQPWIAAPIQTVLAGVGLTVTTPLCCAIFPQKSSIEPDDILCRYLVEPDVCEKINKHCVPPRPVYYNKGL